MNVMLQVHFKIKILDTQVHYNEQPNTFIITRRKPLEGKTTKIII